MTAVPAFAVQGAGATVLMLHGIGGGSLAFAPQLQSFAAAGYRAVAWDMPGYGNSAPIEPYTFEGLAQSCAALIESLQCGRVILLGHSMGGMVAQELLARRPDLVDRLILCGTSPAFGKPDGNWQREFVAQRTAPLEAGRSMAEMAEALVSQMVGPSAAPAGVQLARRCMAQVSAATYRRALQALVTFDRRANLSNIHAPALLVAGEFDRNAPSAVMQKMAAQMTASRYVEMAGVGHLQNLEAPDTFDALVLEFLANT